jgi:hypothetical protein
VILAKSGISTVPTSVITGDIAVSPIDTDAITGFGLIVDSSGEFSTSSQIVGKAFGPGYVGPIAPILTSAVSDMEAAYTNFANRVNNNTTGLNLGAGLLGGVNGGADAPLTPGICTFTSDVTISLDITCSGNSTDIFIIQIKGNLAQAVNTAVILSDGARAENIFWQVAGNVKVGTGAHMEGILLVKTHVVFAAGSSLSGRVLTQTACTLEKGAITEPC